MNLSKKKIDFFLPINLKTLISMSYPQISVHQPPLEGLNKAAPPSQSYQNEQTSQSGQADQTNQSNQAEQAKQAFQPPKLTKLERFALRLGVSAQFLQQLDCIRCCGLMLGVLFAVSMLGMFIASNVLSIIALSTEDFATVRLRALLIYYVVACAMLCIILGCYSDVEWMNVLGQAINCVYCILTFVCFGDRMELLTEIVYWYMFTCSVIGTSVTFLRAKSKQ